MQNIRIAATIFNSVVNRTRNNLDRMLPWIKEASGRSADIICFPELNVTGYSSHSDIKKSAEPIPGIVSRHLVQMAREHQIVILAGLAEKDEKNRIFASHLVVTPKGKARVLNQEIIAQQLLVEMEDSRRVLVDVDEILTVIKKATKGKNSA